MDLKLDDDQPDLQLRSLKMWSKGILGSGSEGRHFTKDLVGSLYKKLVNPQFPAPVGCM